MGGLRIRAFFCHSRRSSLRSEISPVSSCLHFDSAGILYEVSLSNVYPYRGNNGDNFSAVAHGSRLPTVFGGASTLTSGNFSETWGNVSWLCYYSRTRRFSRVIAGFGWNLADIEIWKDLGGLGSWRRIRMQLHGWMRVTCWDSAEVTLHTWGAGKGRYRLPMRKILWKAKLGPYRLHNFDILSSRE